MEHSKYENVLHNVNHFAAAVQLRFLPALAHAAEFERTAAKSTKKTEQRLKPETVILIARSERRIWSPGKALSEQRASMN